MNILNLASNIVKLRHDKSVTQEQLAKFIGVTKASVSKYENGQSLPDIALLPRIAAFFDVTVDNLIGYNPQLSREKIKKIYHDLASDFSKLPFNEVMENSREMVKTYYSCYPFLLQICILWVNHFMLADKQSEQRNILDEIIALCKRITENSKDIGLCNDASIIKAMADLQLGSYDEVIESLEEICNPYRFSSQGCENILSQAYLMTGKSDKSDSILQISMFTHILSVFSNGVQLIQINIHDFEFCSKIISRLDSLSNIFNLNGLHESSAAGYNYQTAIFFCRHGMTEESIERLDKFVSLTINLIKKDIILHGDEFFNKLSDWFENADLGADGLRDKKIVIDSTLQALENPALTPLFENQKYISIKKRLKELEDL